MKRQLTEIYKNEDKKNKYVIIGGINHYRIVGIDKKDEEAYAFYSLNCDGYRPAETKEELEKMKKCAKEYYNICAEKVKTGEFTISYINQEELNKIVDDEADFALAQWE